MQGPIWHKEADAFNLLYFVSATKHRRARTQMRIPLDVTCLATSTQAVKIPCWWKRGQTARWVCMSGRWVFTLLLCVVSVVSSTAERGVPLTAPAGVSAARPGLEQASSGPLSGLPAHWKHKHKPRAHKDTHRPQKLSRALSCSERTDVYPTTFFFLGFVQCIKKKNCLH